jgi:hypothetical protein
LFGPSIDDCLASQLLPASHPLITGGDPRQVLTDRARTLYQLLEERSRL